MGRQVAFWMLEQDTRDFVQFMLSQPHVVMIERFSPSPHLRIVTELLDWPAVHFWNQEFPFQPQWVQVREGPNKGIYGLLPDAEDPVIQFLRSVVRESGELSQGSIWTGCRDEAFLRWYERIERWIRRRYQRVREGTAWAAYGGPHAYEWYQSGGRLVR